MLPGAEHVSPSSGTSRSGSSGVPPPAEVSASPVALPAEGSLVDVGFVVVGTSDVVPDVGSPCPPLLGPPVGEGLPDSDLELPARGCPEDPADSVSVAVSVSVPALADAGLAPLAPDPKPGPSSTSCEHAKSNSRVNPKR